MFDSFIRQLYVMHCNSSCIIYLVKLYFIYLFLSLYIYIYLRIKINNDGAIQKIPEKCGSEAPNSLLQ